MNRFSGIFRYTIPYVIIAMFVTIFCVSSIAVASAEETQSPNCQIAAITLSSEELRVSPGVTIHPTIAVFNSGGEPKPNMTLHFSALLGPSKLIDDNSAQAVPVAGKERMYPISFTIPFIQPGEYPLKITMQQIDESSSEKRSHSMRAKKFIRVTHPRPGAGTRDCGCT